MDLQTRKLNLIEHLTELRDENIFKKNEKLVHNALMSADQSLKQFTEKELIERAQKPNSDYYAGNIKTREQLEIGSKNW